MLAGRVRSTAGLHRREGPDLLAVKGSRPPIRPPPHLHGCRGPPNWAPHPPGGESACSLQPDVYFNPGSNQKAREGGGRVNLCWVLHAI